MDRDRDNRRRSSNRPAAFFRSISAGTETHHSFSSIQPDSIPIPLGLPIVHNVSSCDDPDIIRSPRGLLPMQEDELNAILERHTARYSWQTDSSEDDDMSWSSDEDGETSLRSAQTETFSDKWSEVPRPPEEMQSQELLLVESGRVQYETGNAEPPAWLDYSEVGRATNDKQFDIVEALDTFYELDERRSERSRSNSVTQVLLDHPADSLETMYTHPQTPPGSLDPISRRATTPTTVVTSLSSSEDKQGTSTLVHIPSPPCRPPPLPDGAPPLPARAPPAPPRPTVINITSNAPKAELIETSSKSIASPVRVRNRARRHRSRPTGSEDDRDQRPRRLATDIRTELKDRVALKVSLKLQAREKNKLRRLQTLFMIIQNGNNSELESFLCRHGNMVEIVPKFGCHEKHYTEENIVNVCDAFGNAPLLLTCKMGWIRNWMVLELLKYGANPNHYDRNGDYPLVYVAQSASLNPSQENKDLLKQLIFHGADINLAVDALCAILLSPNKESRTAMMSLGVLIDPAYFILGKDPIKTAHLCSERLMIVSKKKEEYITDCMILAAEAGNFSYNFLDCCRTLWEARRLLCGSNYIEDSVMTHEMAFLAHPFCQEIILEEFYGCQDFMSFRKRLRFLVMFIAGMFLIPLYSFGVFTDSIKSGCMRYKYSRLDYLMRELITPLYCFLADTVNYVILLVLLVTVAMTLRSPDSVLITSENGIKSKELRARIPIQEVFLWLALLSRLTTEVYQLCIGGFRKYFSNFWNYIDDFICLLLTMAFGIRIWSVTSQHDIVIEQDDIEFDNYLLTAVYIYGITQILVFFRVMNVLDVWSFIGPLQLAVKRMLGDVAKLIILLLLILFGFVFSIFSIADCYRDVMFPDPVEREKVYSSFRTFHETLLSLTWSLFDIIGSEALIAPHSGTHLIILCLVVLYSMIASVIILNMLIAMLNHTYDKIQTNQDIEWKYSRAKLFLEYKKGIPAIFPFILIVSPVYIAYRVAKSYGKRTKLKIHTDYNHCMKNRTGRVEVDGSDLEAASKQPPHEDDLQEVKMRYLLINELVRRVKIKHERYR